MTIAGERRIRPTHVCSSYTSQHFTRNNGGCTDLTIGHFTVAYLDAWAMNASEAGGDLALTQTSPLLSLTEPFNNMRNLKFKARPKNAFFATVNQMFGDSSQLPTTAEQCSLSELCSTI